MSQSDLPIAAAMRAEVIEGLLSKLHRYYVFPAVAQEVEAAICAQVAAGADDAVIAASVLCVPRTAALHEFIAARFGAKGGMQPFYCR